jgi:endonuclease/exonuclease/phosphatase family metal-dependent hydrolase
VSGPPLRVGSYNLWVAHWPATATYDRAPLVRAALDHVDVLGTQEGTREHLAALTAGTGFAAVGRSRDGGTTGEHSAILYRTERLRVLGTGDFWLSETPELPSTGWDAAYRRLCTWGRFQDLGTGATFVLLNAHLDHEGTRARLESARLLVTRVRALAGDGPAVVTGDLNAEPGSEPLRALLGGGLVDARAVSRTPPVGPEATFTPLDDPDDPDRPRGPGRRRIDYVLVSPDVVVGHHAVLDSRPGGRFPSDHDPSVVVQVQPAVRARRRSASSSRPVPTGESSSARSVGSSARVPSTSRHTRPTAMPNTPCPPCTRSMTSSAEVHSYTDAPSDIRVICARSSTPRSRRWPTAARICCRETPVSSSRLTTFSTRMSRNEYRRCVPEPVAGRTEGSTRPVRAQ